MLARGLNQKTPLGAYLDPIADKLLLSSSYFVLALQGRVAWWLAILVLGRDVLLLVASAVIIVTVGYMSLPPSIWGKATTFFEILMIFLVLVLAIWDNHVLWVLKGICAYCVAAFVAYRACTTVSLCRGGCTRAHSSTSIQRCGLARRGKSPRAIIAKLAATARRRRPAQHVRALAFLGRGRRAIHHDFAEYKAGDEPPKCAKLSIPGNTNPMIAM